MPRWDAKDYEKHSRGQQVWARELIAKMGLEGAERVLDLGCGDGKVTAEIAEALPEGAVVGVDSSPEMIELATQKFSGNSPQGKRANLSFQVMDARALRFEGCFDWVFSNAALHWVREHRPVVEGLARSLKPGGKILLQMGGRGNAREVLGVLDEMIASPEWAPFFLDFPFPYGFLGVEEYEQLLADCGFLAKRVELIPKDMKHEGKPGLEGWIRTTWLPYTERVPERRRGAFVEEIVARYLEKEPLDEDGVVHVAMMRLEVEAEMP